MSKNRFFIRKLILAEFVLDTLAIIVSFVLGYLIWSRFFSAERHQSFEVYGSIIFYALPILLLSFKNSGLYKQQMGILHIREVTGVIQGVGLGFLIIFALSFFTRQLQYSRLSTLFAALTCFVLVSLERLIVIKFIQNRHKKGVGIQDACIFGTCDIAKRFAKKIIQMPKLGYRIIGFLSNQERIGEKITGGLKVVGSLDNMNAVIEKHQIRIIFICLPNDSESIIPKIMQICNGRDVIFKIVPNMYQLMLEDIYFENIDGIPLISIKRYEAGEIYPIFKRIFDFFLSLFLFIILFPLGLIIAGLIKIDSKGPVLFKQKRVGDGGKIFTILKFRTMNSNVEKYAYTPRSSSDPRITMVGRYLRRLSLDELPQLINILRSDMSFVGPRPEMQFIVDKYNEIQKRRLKVRPGLTGLWQISSDRATQIHENMDYDLFYIKHQSFLLDLAIILRTFISIIKGTGAW